jgi:hypothetical protein
MQKAPPSAGLFVGARKLKETEAAAGNAQALAADSS